MCDFIKNLLIIFIKNSWRILKFIGIIIVSIFISIIFSNKMSVWLYGKDDNQIELFVVFVSSLLGFITSLILSNKQFKTEIYKNEINPSYNKYKEFINKEYVILLREYKFYYFFNYFENLIEISKSINQNFFREDIRLIFERNIEHVKKIFFWICKSKRIILEYFIYYYKISDSQIEEIQEYILRIMDINYSNSTLQQKIEYIKNLECSLQQIKKEFIGEKISNFLRWLNNNYEIQELEKNINEFINILKWEMKIVEINTKYAEYQIRFDNYRDV